MTTQRFAEVYRLQLHKDGCGDPVLVGKQLVQGNRREHAHHIFDGYVSGLGAYFNCQTARQWTSIRRRLVATGAVLRQNGDVDGVVEFNPESKPLAMLVLKLTGARAKRQLTSEQKQALADRLARAREARS